MAPVFSVSRGSRWLRSFAFIMFAFITAACRFIRYTLSRGECLRGIFEVFVKPGCQEAERFSWKP